MGLTGGTGKRVDTNLEIPSANFPASHKRRKTKPIGHVTEEGPTEARVLEDNEGVRIKNAFT